MVLQTFFAKQPSHLRMYRLETWHGQTSYLHTRSACASWCAPKLSSSCDGGRTHEDLQGVHSDTGLSWYAIVPALPLSFPSIPPACLHRTGVGTHSERRMCSKSTQHGTCLQHTPAHTHKGTFLLWSPLSNLNNLSVIMRAILYTVQELDSWSIFLKTSRPPKLRSRGQPELWIPCGESMIRQMQHLLTGRQQQQRQGPGQMGTQNHLCILL